MARDAILTFDKMDKAFQAEIQATMRRRLKHPTTFDKGVYERLTIDRKRVVEYIIDYDTAKSDDSIQKNATKKLGVHILFETTRKTLDVSVGNSVHRVECIPTRQASTWKDQCVAFAAIGTPTAAFSVDVQYASSRQSVEDKTFIIQTTKPLRANFKGKLDRQAEVYDTVDGDDRNQGAHEKITRNHPRVYFPLRWSRMVALGTRRRLCITRARRQIRQHWKTFASMDQGFIF